MLDPVGEGFGPWAGSSLWSFELLPGHWHHPGEGRATRALPCTQHTHSAALQCLTEQLRAPGLPALHRLRGTQSDRSAQAYMVPMSCDPERCCTRGSSEDHSVELELDDSWVPSKAGNSTTPGPCPVADAAPLQPVRECFASQLPGRCPAREGQSSLPLAPGQCLDLAARGAAAHGESESTQQSWRTEEPCKHGITECFGLEGISELIPFYPLPWEGTPSQTPLLRSPQ